MSAWRVYHGNDLVLTMQDGPGTLTSTAPRTPGAPPVSHPFVSVTARDAGHEAPIRALLEVSSGGEDFRGRLRAAGYRIEAG